LSTNPELDIFTKNVEKLIVKVFEINTRNYYLKYGKEIDTDISLDGLVANSQQLAEYSDSPLLRTKRSFTFDQIGKRGVYVIDFIGGGKSSRALSTLSTNPAASSSMPRYKSAAAIMNPMKTEASSYRFQPNPAV